MRFIPFGAPYLPVIPFPANVRFGFRCCCLFSLLVLGARGALITTNEGIADNRMIDFTHPEGSTHWIFQPQNIAGEYGETVRWTSSENCLWISGNDVAFGENGHWGFGNRTGIMGSAIRPGERVWMKFEFTGGPAHAASVFLNYTRGNYHGADPGSTVMKITALDAAGQELESHNLLEEAPIIITANYPGAGMVRGIARPQNDIAALVIESDGRFFAFDDLRIARLGRGKLVNISTRSAVAVGGRLISGFVIEEEPAQVLVRAVGPGLLEYGVEGVMANPRLVLFQQDMELVANEDWSIDDNEEDIAAAAAKVGAFGLTPGSGDASILITLLPGVYTVQASDVDAGGGEVLIEVYQVPDETAD